MMIVVRNIGRQGTHRVLGSLSRNRYSTWRSSSDRAIYTRILVRSSQVINDSGSRIRPFSSFTIASQNQSKKNDGDILNTIKDEESESEDGKNSKENTSSFTGHYIGMALSTSLVAGLVLSEDFRNGSINFILTTQRVMVVTVATARCFRLYWKTLRSKDTLDTEEYYRELSKTHKRAALITLKALETNGGIYIKLGQHVSAMTYLLPPEWTDTMTPLQHNCPESSLSEIKEMFLKDTGIELMDYFEEIEPVPIGVASLAQVHIGRLRNSHEKTAVKFQHPSLDKFVPLDVFLTRTVFDLMAKVFPEYSLTWLGDELHDSIFVELDFRNEAKNAERTSEYFKDFSKDTSLVIPKIYDAKRRVLIMEYIGGTRLDDLQYLDDHNISRGQVSSCLSHIFNNMIFTPGVGLHCDPHGGNLAIRAMDKSKSVSGLNFEIILYDHGLYRNIPEDMRLNYAKFWLALIDKDKSKMQKYGTKFASISDDQFPILAAAITGRDFEHAMNDVTSVRKESEIDNMTSQLVDNGLILDLMKLLATIPRIVLLILKTNDLTRHLDESLQNPLGTERTFLIMAMYCSKLIYNDEIDKNNKSNKKWGIQWWKFEINAFIKYYKRCFQLNLYDFIFYLDNTFGVKRHWS